MSMRGGGGTRRRQMQLGLYSMTEMIDCSAISVKWSCRTSPGNKKQRHPFHVVDVEFIFIRLILQWRHTQQIIRSVSHFAEIGRNEQLFIISIGLQKQDKKSQCNRIHSPSALIPQYSPTHKPISCS